MASCLWMYPCLLSIIMFTFVATAEMKDNVTCTFTNGKDCAHLLNVDDTKEYTIEKEDINRTGIKINFGTELGIQFLRVESGEALENRVQVLNITRGSLNHYVNLSCSKEQLVDRIKLEPVVVSEALQIDFVKGCGNESDPITIKSIFYTVGTDEDEHLQDASERIPLMEETQTDGDYIPTELSDIDLLTTPPTDQEVKLQEGLGVDEEEEEVEEVTVKTTRHPQTKGMKPIPTAAFTKRRLVATGKPMRVTTDTIKKKKEEKPVVKKADDNRIDLKVKYGASTNSGPKVSRDFVCLFLAFFLFKNA